MGLALHLLALGAFAALSFVSAQRNVSLDDNDPSIIYSSGWNVSRGNHSFDFGGSLHFSDDETATATLVFQGIALYLMGPFWSSNVGAQVTIDGQGPFIVNFEDQGVDAEEGLGNETIRSQVVWAATQLSDSQHTLVISKPPAMQFAVLDGVIFTTTQQDNNAASIAASASDSFLSTTTTATITETFTSSSNSPSPFFNPSTLTSSARSQSPSSSSLIPFPSSPAPSKTYDMNNVPINAAASAAQASPSAVTAAATVAPVQTLSVTTRRTIVIASIFAAMMLTLAVIVILTCLRRRRVRKRKQRSYEWSQKLRPTPFQAHATRMGAASQQQQQQRGTDPGSPSYFQYARAPATARSAAPLMPPPAPHARRAPIPRSPLVTAQPIMAASPSPSPQVEELPCPWPMPPPLSATASSPLSPPSTGASNTRTLSPLLPAHTLPPPTPAPVTPLPFTPPPPVTPGTPWSTSKSSRLSGSSTYSFDSSVETSLGYGWTTPSLVGIHPFSASAEALSQPMASGSSSSSSSSSRTITPAAPRYPAATTALTPVLSEKAALAALQRTTEAQASAGTDTQRLSAAPAYREKDAAHLFRSGRARATSRASESAPPLYEP